MSARTPDRPRPSPPRRTKVTPQQYRARRLVALAVVVLVLVGFVKLIGAVFGSSGTAASGSDPAGSTAVSTDGLDARRTDSSLVTDGSGSDAGVPVGSRSTDASGSAVPAGQEATTGEGATGAAPATARARVTPSAATPAKVLIAGDSDAGTFGPYLVTLLDETGVVDSTLDYKVSSGLSRPDFFDWPQHFREQVAAVQPDIVIVTFGGNDAQGLSTIDGTFIVNQPSGTVADGSASSGSDPEWRAEYGRRVGEVMDFLGADGRTLLWVGIPNDDQETFTARLAVQNDVVKAEAAKRAAVVFIDTWSRFSGRDGHWAEYVIDPRDGQGKDVRADDGFHLNENGAEILALDIAEAVRAELRTRGAVF
jgi:hypothetical protein